ncbi:MAG: Ppx/GppA phosphatase family protein [Desulfuromonadales bacterium]
MPASIDVGTNTVRMLIGEVSDGQVAPDKYRRSITRLGGGFSREKGLSPAAMSRTLETLQEFAEEIRSEGVRSVRAVGTEALRKAPNGGQFAKEVQTQTGLPLEIIAGDEEARLASAGVLAALSPQPDQCLIFDIGGGSTEFILAEGGRVSFHKSYSLGVVRLAEDVSSIEERTRVVESAVDELIHDLAANGCQLKKEKNFALVGTAGTVTTLAAIDMEMADYDWRRVNNHRLERQSLIDIYQRLLDLSPEEREEVPGMEKGRGDLIIPGISVVLELLAKIDCSFLIVSDFGLLEGALIDLSSS